MVLFKLFFRRHSIGFKLLLGVLIFSTSLTTILTFVNFFVDYRMEMNKIGDSYKAIRETMIKTISGAVWGYHIDLIKSNIFGLTNLPHIINAAVYDQEAEKLADTNLDYDKNDMFLETVKFDLVSDGSLGKDQNVGKLILMVTKKEIYIALAKKLGVFFITQGVKTFLISFFIMAIFYKLVGSPVIRISQALLSMNISQPEFLDNKIWDHHPESELYGLGTSINKMVRKIREMNALNLQALQKSEKNLAKAQKVARIGSWEYNIHDETIFWSGQMRQIFSRKDDEYLTFDEHASYIHDEDRELWLKKINECLASGNRFNVRVRGISGRNSDSIFLDITGEGEKNEIGDITVITGTTQDVTDSIKAEMALEEQRRIATHNAHLASIGELAGGVGHEINNPLTIIKGYMSFIMKSVASANDETKKQVSGCIERIFESITRIQKLLSGLRAFSEQDTFNYQDFGARDFIANTIKDIEGILFSDDIDFDVQNLIDTDVYFHGDRGRIAQIIINLVKNATEATLNNDRDRKITLTAKVSENEKLIIEIEDNGTGIREELRDQIFIPFFTTKDVSQGVGLGLAKAKIFLKEHKGEITFDSQVGSGTTFKILFPVHRNIEKMAS